MRVAQAVGMDALLNPRLGRQAGEEPADIGGIERLAGQGAEDRTPAREPERSTAVHPALEEGEGGRVHTDRAPPVALAVWGQATLVARDNATRERLRARP